MVSYSFGKRSKEKISSLDPRLQSILFKAIQLYDFSVLEGYRSDERQEELFAQGKSKLRAGESKHNSNPSKAVDLAPYPIDWTDAKRFVHLAGIIIALGHSMGVKILWGGNWDMDNVIIDDQRFDDLPHFEIVED